MDVKQTARLIRNDLFTYKIKYGLVRGIWRYLNDFYDGKFFEKK